MLIGMYLQVSRNRLSRGQMLPVFFTLDKSMFLKILKCGINVLKSKYIATPLNNSINFKVKRKCQRRPCFPKIFYSNIIIPI